jgi:hypothetical protein
MFSLYSLSAVCWRLWFRSVVGSKKRIHNLLQFQHSETTVHMHTCQYTGTQYSDCETTNLSSDTLTMHAHWNCNKLCILFFDPTADRNHNLQHTALKEYKLNITQSRQLIYYLSIVSVSEERLVVSQSEYCVPVYWHVCMWTVVSECY